MIEGELHIEDAKLKKFLISIYQSVFFNEWLKERVLMSREKNAGKYMLLDGDIYQTSEGKLFTPKKKPTKDFEDAKVMPTGLLCGRMFTVVVMKPERLKRSMMIYFFMKKVFVVQRLFFQKI